MADVKITDLVDPKAIQELIDLDNQLAKLLDTYVNVARQLSAGLEVPIKNLSDLQKAEEELAKSTQTAIETQQKMTSVVERKQAVIANTTNTISRQLMEQERVNKQTREEYTGYDNVIAMLQKYNGSYQEKAKNLLRVTAELKAAKEQEKALDKQLKEGTISQAAYDARMLDLTVHSRELKAEKADIEKQMRAEEKMNQALADSYNGGAQQLELLKMAYKNLSAAERESASGRELERAIQDLDAHLKDTAADMGEFQRNVGNYAIAGRDGIVSTDSLTAALNQQAITTQDVADQTKILEEAKRMLDTTDKNYDENLARINAQLDENKARLSDVSDILGKQPGTVAEAEEQNRRLAEALKHIDLNSEGAKEKIKAYNDQIESNQEIIDSATGSNEQFADQMLSLVGVNANFGSSLQGISKNGNFLDGLTGKVKAFGSTLTGLLANPWVLAFVGIAGVAAGFKWWYDYNAGLVEATKLTQDFTGLTGDAMKNARSEVQGVADMYGKDFQEVLEATNAVSKQFGISFEEAMGYVKDGFVAGADANGEFIENLKEYPAYFNEAGVSASEFIAITTQANKAGIYSDKGIDVIKEGNLRIREMTKSTAAALDGIGISSKKVMKDLADGSTTTFEVMQEVGNKLKEYPESATEVGTALADIFGGPGEDAGLQYITMLGDMKTNLDEVKNQTGELGSLQEQQLQSEIELQQTMASVFDQTGGAFETITANAKIFINKGLITIINWIKVIIDGVIDVVNWCIRLYNKSLVVRAAVAAISGAFTMIWEVAKSAVGLIIDAFKAVGKIIEGVLTFDSDKIIAGWKEGGAALRKQVANIARSTAGTYKNILNQTMGGVELKEYPHSSGGSKSGGGGGGGGVTPSGGGDKTKKKPYTPKSDDDKKKKSSKSKKSDDSEKKEAEKRAQELLKISKELEDKRIAAMYDGYDKRAALIKKKAREELEKIKGNSEKEQELRAEIIKGMDKELADLDADFYSQLEKENLENRLKTVQEGSDEERMLREALLKQQREAELAANKERLKAAEAMPNKTDEEVKRRTEELEAVRQEEAAINADYDQKQAEELEKFNEKRNKLIQDRYSVEAEIRDNNLADELLAINKEYAAKIALVGNNEEKRAELQEQYEDRCAEITEKYAVKSAQASIDMYEEMLMNERLTEEEHEEIARKLAAARIALEKEVTEAFKNEGQRQVDNDKKALQKKMDAVNKWLQVASDGLNAINDLSQQLFENQITKIDEELEANQAAGEQEQADIDELVQKKIITEEEGEARKRAAQAETARKEEELERKKMKIKRKQAIFDKANSIAQALISTAMSIATTAGQLGFPAAIPWIAIAGALGAMQVATIAATPLPQYRMGTDYHKGGYAIVGDGGQQEVVSYRNNLWLTPDVPTLVDLPRGASVTPSIEQLALDCMTPIPGIPDLPNEIVVNNDYRDLKREVMNVASVIKRHSARQHADAIAAKYDVFKKSKI